MKFNYKGKEYELKYSFRALMVYENITNKSFQPKSLTDIITLFYSMVITSSKDAIDFNEFIDFLDDNPDILNEFSHYLLGITKMNDLKAPEIKIEDKKEEKKEEDESKN